MSKKIALHSLKIAGTWDEMDVLARAQFLEGFLRIRPFGLIRGTTGKVGLLKAINRALQEIGGTPNPLWAASQDTGLYRATFGAVNKVIRSMRGERAMEAVDVLQSMMGLAGWETDEGETIELGGKSPFWAAGKHVGEHTPDNFMSGKMAPYDAAGLAIKLAYRRALDVVRQEADRAKKRQEQESLIREETVGEEPEEDWSEIVDAIFANPESSVSKRFFGWLIPLVPNIMRRSEGARTITNYLELLRTNTVQSDTEAATALGLSPSGLSNTKKVFSESLAGYLSANPAVQEEVEGLMSDAQFFQDLLRGRIRGRMASASRVAERFLGAARSGFTFKRDVKLKDGSVIPAGTEATVTYDGKSTLGYVQTMLRPEPFRISIRSLTVLLNGYPKMPGLSRLEKMSDEGVATTPTGKRVEPDGFGPDGSPSWMLVAGVI